VDTEAYLAYAYSQAGVDAETAEVTWLNVQKADLASALTYAKGTSALGATYDVVSASHNDRGQGSADVTQRLKKVGTGSHIPRTVLSGEAAEERVYVLPYRASEPSEPNPTGFTLVSKVENSFDEVLATWEYTYRKTYTLAGGASPAAAFLFVQDNPSERAERRRRKYFGVESAVTTDSLFTTATAGYQVVSIDIAEQGKGFADVTVTEVRVFADAAVTSVDISLANPGTNIKQLTRRYINVTDADIDHATYTTATAGYKVVKIDAPKDGSGIGDVIVTEVELGTAWADDKYSVMSRFYLDAAAETYTEVFPNWATDPEDHGSWAEPTNYNLIDSTTTEKGEGVADYTYEWGRVEDAVSVPADEGEIIAENHPLHPNGASTTKIFRNQSWTNGKALVQTLKALANTVSAVARPKPGLRCDVVWEYRTAPGSAYSLNEYATRYRSIQEPTLSGNEVTKWAKKSILEDITIVRTITFYASVTAANSAAATAASALNGGESLRVFPLPDGSAYTEKVDIGDSRTSATVLWESTV